jgi:filamentous hemagglutinin family protein
LTGGTISTSGTGNLTLTGGTVTTSGTSITIIPTITNKLTPPTVRGGAATLTITPGAIINWTGFSIAAGEVTSFAQTSASSTVLNRVLGNQVPILGTLTSNGKVWLVDSAGNLVIPTRVVSTDGLKLASVSIQTPNPVATPSARPTSTARPQAQSVLSGISGLVDGTVTVRLSLVDAAPISLR